MGDRWTSNLTALCWVLEGASREMVMAFMGIPRDRSFDAAFDNGNNDGKRLQCNNRKIFHRTATLICSVVICHATMVLPSIVVCNAVTLIHGIVFGCAATATARNRAMGAKMAVALEEEGIGEGGKSNGNGDKEGNGK